METKETKQNELPLEDGNIKAEKTSGDKPASRNEKEEPGKALAKKEEYTPERTREAINKLPAELSGIKKLFAAPWESFRSAFKDPGEADRIMQREITYASQAMLGNPYLIKCATENPMDFVNALKNVALSGLSLSPTLKQGYLVPFKGKVTFMPSFMGMQDLLANNGHVRKIEAYAVFKGDEFEMVHGTDEKIVHKPNPWGERTKETFLGCYWIVELVDGTKKFNNMTKAEIDAVMKRSPSVGQGKQTPWESDYIEMATKTCLRRGFKALPKGTISEDRLRALEAVFDYDEKVEQNWIAEQKREPKILHTFDEEAEYEEIS